MKGTQTLYLTQVWGVTAEPNVNRAYLFSVSENLVGLSVVNSIESIS
jgi:hypothetical protein